VQYTATTALLTCPVVPVYWRPTPAVALPYLLLAGLVEDQHCPGHGQVAHGVRPGLTAGEQRCQLGDELVGFLLEQRGIYADSTGRLIFICVTTP
jgi:hypothetical protein